MALTAPQNFTATTGAYYGEIDLNWDDLAGAVSYNIYRRLTSAGGTYFFIGTSTVSSVRAINLNANTSYDFVVVGVDVDDLQGAFSASATATTIGPGDAPPRVPVGVQITPGNARNTLSWLLGAADVYAWHVKRGTVDGGPYTEIDPGGFVGEPALVDTNLVNDTTYYYVITADNNLESANSAQVSGTPVDPNPGGGTDPGGNPGGGVGDPGGDPGAGGIGTPGFGTGVYILRRRR